MRRRDFLRLIGGLAIWPLPTRAQQAGVPVIGILLAVSEKGFEQRIRAFRQGLRDGGYLEGRNVAIEYRWGENQQHRLPALAADLIQKNVAALVALGGPSSALAAQAATKTIPIIFGVPDDPVSYARKLVTA